MITEPGTIAIASCKTRPLHSPANRNLCATTSASNQKMQRILDTSCQNPIRYSGMNPKEIKISFRRRVCGPQTTMQEILDGPAKESSEPTFTTPEDRKALQRAAAWRKMFREEMPILMN